MPVNFKKYWLLTIFSSTLLFGQNNELRFTNVDIEANVVQSPIIDIIQTKRGFVWIATEDGLIKYDGFESVKYMRDNRQGSLTNNYVNTIFEDSKEQLWIGTRNGINSYNSTTNAFCGVGILPIKGGQNYISAFIEDKDNNIWVGTFDGLKKLNQEAKALESVPEIQKSDNLEGNKILSLFIDSQNLMWIGTVAGLKCFDLNTRTLLPLSDLFKNDQGLSNSKIWKTFENTEGGFWFASEKRGVFKYNRKLGTVIQFSNTIENENLLASNKVIDILEVDNKIWFATNNGLSVFDEDTNSFSNYTSNPLVEYSISSNTINAFLKDRDGNIWLGTFSGEINMLNKNTNNVLTFGKTTQQNFGLNNNLIKDFLTETPSSLWVATHGGGLNYLDFENQSSSYYLIKTNDSTKTNNIISSLAPKDENSLWCGTYNGIYVFDKNKKSFSKIPLNQNDPNYEDKEVTSILNDGKNTWVAVFGDGLKLIFNDRVIKSYATSLSEQTISDNYIMDLESAYGGLWIATQNGLNYFDKTTEKFTRYLKEEVAHSISNNNLTCLYRDSKNRLWIGTDFGGLNYFDETTKKFYKINATNGLTDQSISEITEDENQNLWVSSSTDLYKITFSDFSPPFEKENFEVIKYSSLDGLNIKHYSVNSSAKLRSNELIFGGSNGLQLIDTRKIEKFRPDYSISLTKLRVNNQMVLPGVEDSPLEKPIYETSQIQLNYNQGYVGLDFTTFNFAGNLKNQFEYKLDKFPFKDDWHSLGFLNAVNLNGLTNGEYKLSLRVQPQSDVHDAKVTQLGIIVLPPWWKTWWAYLTYVVFTLFILLIIKNFVQNRIKLKKKLFLEQVEKERQTELYQMKLDFFTNISHEFRTPLTLISGPLEELIDKSKDNPEVEHKLSSIKMNSDRLLRLVNELVDLRKSEKGKLKIYCEEYDFIPFCFGIYDNFRGLAEKKNIDYKFVMNTNNIWLYFDKNQMEKVIYNILSNAFKFTPDNGKISVVVEQRMEDSEWVDVLIKDNGIGIPENSKNKIFKSFFQADDRRIESKGSGLGLALAKSIVKLHKGKIEAKTEKVPRGNASSTTIFKISLKKGKEHLEGSQILESNNKVIQEQEELQKLDSIFQKNVLEPAVEINENSKTIMVIDDNPEINTFITDILKDDYKVITFENGHDALEHLNNELPDLVISDVMMPNMDGLELCQSIKTTESTNHIPVILLTAKSSTLNRIEGLSTGADSYISKPFSTKVLKLNISNILNNKEIMRQKYSGRFMVDSELKSISSPEDIFIKKLMTVIETNLENPNFDVDKLVQEIGMSRTVLYKKVQSITNYSVGNLIKKIRLKKAADILKSTNFHVSEVAFMVGFNDRKYFSKEFKKVYKKTPSEYKLNLNNQQV